VELGIPETAIGGVLACQLHIPNNFTFYRSPQLARIAASLCILIVHTPPYQPEGCGKIERFFRSLREQFLAVTGHNICLVPVTSFLVPFLTLLSGLITTGAHRFSGVSVRPAWDRILAACRQ
jgi:transposase InsO family protein